MPEYRVRWEIDLSADSPEEAATEARRIQLDPDSIAQVFDIMEDNGVTIQVDLDEGECYTRPEKRNIYPEE